MKMNEWPPEPTNLKEMVQIESKSHVSADFINEYTFPLGFLSLMLSGSFDIKDQFDIDEILNSFRIIKEKGLRTYEERFPSTEFSNPVTEDNELVVGEIDKRMLELRNIFFQEWTLEDVENRRDQFVHAKSLMEEITKIIRNGIPYKDINTVQQEEM